VTWSADPEGSIGVVAEGWEGVRGAELLRAQLPKEDILVVADQAFAPYAGRRPDQVTQRVHDLAAGLLDEGAKALLLAGGFASFEARPEFDGFSVRGLECGLRTALAEAKGRPIAAVFSSTEVKTMVLAKSIRTLRGGGSVTLIERGTDPARDLLMRIRKHAPDVAVVLLLTPSAYADADEVRELAGDVTVVDGLAATVDFVVHDIRRHRLLAHHGERAGRITAFATRGGTTGITREPLSTASVAALQRRG
jgi:glutamate racemase